MARDHHLGDLGAGRDFERRLSPCVTDQDRLDLAAKISRCRWVPGALSTGDAVLQGQAGTGPHRRASTPCGSSMAMPQGTAMRAPGASLISAVDGGQQIQSRRSCRGIGGQRQMLGMRQAFDSDFHIFWAFMPHLSGSGRCAPPGGPRLRPWSSPASLPDASPVIRMDAVALAAHHRFLTFIGGDVIGDDPVCAFASPFGGGIGRSRPRFPQQSRSGGARRFSCCRWPGWPECLGFSTSFSRGTTRSVLFLILLLADMSGRQSVTDRCRHHGDVHRQQAFAGRQHFCAPS